MRLVGYLFFFFVIMDTITVNIIISRHINSKSVICADGNLACELGLGLINSTCFLLTFFSIDQIWSSTNLQFRCSTFAIIRLPSTFQVNVGEWWLRGQIDVGGGLNGDLCYVIMRRRHWTSSYNDCTIPNESERIQELMSWWAHTIEIWINDITKIIKKHNKTFTSLDWNDRSTAPLDDAFQWVALLFLCINVLKLTTFGCLYL